MAGAIWNRAVLADSRDHLQEVAAPIGEHVASRDGVDVER